MWWYIIITTIVTAIFWWAFTKQKEWYTFKWYEKLGTLFFLAIIWPIYLLCIFLPDRPE